MKYRKKPVIIEADRPFEDTGRVPTDPREGAVVRRYRHPDDSGERQCEKCLCKMKVHGWIETFEGGHIVCPGDWIITGTQGERYPCKPDIFSEIYEAVPE